MSNKNFSQSFVPAVETKPRSNRVTSPARRALGIGTRVGAAGLAVGAAAEIALPIMSAPALADGNSPVVKYQGPDGNYVLDMALNLNTDAGNQTGILITAPNGFDICGVSTHEPTVGIAVTSIDTANSKAVGHPSVYDDEVLVDGSDYGTIVTNAIDALDQKAMDLFRGTHVGYREFGVIYRMDAVNGLMCDQLIDTGTNVQPTPVAPAVTPFVPAPAVEPTPAPATPTPVPGMPECPTHDDLARIIGNSPRDWVGPELPAQPGQPCGDGYQVEPTPGIEYVLNLTNVPGYAEGQHVNGTPFVASGRYGDSVVEVNVNGATYWRRGVMDLGAFRQQVAGAHGIDANTIQKDGR